MKKQWIRWIFPLVLSVLLVSCNLPFGQKGSMSSSAAATYVAQYAALTLQAKTAFAATATAGFTPEASLTPTITLTPEPSLTPTIAGAWLVINEKSNCRQGPDNYYKLVALLQPGDKVQVLGKDPFEQFYYVRLNDAASSLCWVWNKYTSISGEVNRIPELTAIPTPTPTFTPTIAPDFGVNYVGLDTCSGSYFLRLQLHNTGSTTWQSLRIYIVDNTTGSSFTHTLDTFSDYSGCTNDSNQKDLSYGEDGYVTNYNPGQFNYDPTGHSLSVSVTLYSEDGENGINVGKAFNVTP